MENTQGSSTSLWVGIILGILIIGGIFLYLRGNTGATAPADKASINISVPTGTGDAGKSN